jgi:hypothetical protein
MEQSVGGIFPVLTQVTELREHGGMMFRCRTRNGEQSFSVAMSADVYALRTNEGQVSMYHWEKA